MLDTKHSSILLYYDTFQTITIQTFQNLEASKSQIQRKYQRSSLLFQRNLFEPHVKPETYGGWWFSKSQKQPPRDVQNPSYLPW